MLMKLEVNCVCLWCQFREELLAAVGQQFQIKMHFELSYSNQIKSNQILFKMKNVHLKEKNISKKLFTRLYTITITMSYIFDLSFWYIIVK